MQKQIALTVNGLDADDGHVRLPELTKELQLLGSGLKKLDLALSGADEPSTIFRVIKLSHNSPTEVTLGAFPADPAAVLDRSGQLVDEFIDRLSAIARGESPRDGIDQGWLEDIKAMAEMAGKRVGAVTLLGAETVVEFTRTFVKRLEKALAPESSYPGFVRGMLEAINIHENANTFQIYPDVGPKKVRCVFPADLTAQAVQGVNRFVEVRGTLQYRAFAPHPYSVAVTEIDVLPDESELPTLFDLAGLMGRG
jgi:hypothetical protein